MGTSVDLSSVNMFKRSWRITQQNRHLHEVTKGYRVKENCGSHPIQNCSDLRQGPGDEGKREGEWGVCVCVCVCVCVFPSFNRHGSLLDPGLSLSHQF